jgi:hypothetical protein
MLYFAVFGKKLVTHSLSHSKAIIIIQAVLSFTEPSTSPPSNGSTMSPVMTNNPSSGKFLLSTERKVFVDLGILD